MNKSALRIIFFSVVFAFVFVLIHAHSVSAEESSVILQKERDFYNGRYEKNKQAIVVVQALVAAPTTPKEEHKSKSAESQRKNSLPMRSLRFDFTVEV
ncbi:MAG: hypothetical protein HYW88_02370, partial [Candidatus Sungbacteria bacterium]|nr:hypothetical protein [Candidatus Sungbacteria bacterium]